MISTHLTHRKNTTLACKRLIRSHTFDKVTELIIDIHSEYDLVLSKIIKTVFDNGSNNVKALKVNRNEHVKIKYQM